jgi:voltage-gated potassium channel
MGAATQDERSQRVAQRFQWPMIVAALLVIPALILEESKLGEPATTFGLVLNALIWVAFAVELVTMLIVVPNRRRYLARHPLDVLIVLFTGPFLPAAWQALRVVRLLRVARLFRVFSLRRVISLEGVKYAALIVGLLVILGGALFAAVEGQGLTTWDGVWWAVTTVTTVGYGDISPQTDGGRAIAIVIMAAGIGFVAILTAYVAERFVTAGREAGEHEKLVMAELRMISDRLHRLETVMATETSVNKNGANGQVGKTSVSRGESATVVQS